MRPLPIKTSHHLVLKATSANHLQRARGECRATLNKYSSRFGIRLISHAIQADHIHLHIRVTSRRQYCAWIRALTGLLAMRIRGLKFKFSPYSRPVRSGRDYHNVNSYLARNEGEASLIILAHRHVIEWQKSLAWQNWRGAFDSFETPG